jgi:NAD(P)-dependent dehydrogenase (short-subunit alcohol dehydrogenase family)
MDFRGKSVIVTGSGQGIGRSIAKDLAARGAHVLVCDLRSKGVDAVVSEIRRSGGTATSFLCDATNPQQVDSLINVALGSFGKIDILVNNVGGSGTQGVDQIEEVTDDIWSFIMDLNMKSMFLCSRAAVPSMKTRGYGKIVNLSSMAAHGSFGGRGAAAARLPYAGAKAGVVGFTLQLAKDLGPFGINVNAVMPGLILTEPGTRIAERYATLSEEAKQKSLERVPLGRRGTPEEVAKAVAFLASDDASYITGAVLEVAGGM